MHPFNWVIVGLGCLGGLIPDLLRFIKGRYEKPASYLSYWNFLLGLVLLIILGGVIAWLLGAENATQALAYGFGGPEIIRKVLSEPGPVSGVDRGAGGFTLFRWWKG
jgi:purine-cytosine permease-like protein